MKRILQIVAGLGVLAVLGIAAVGVWAKTAVDSRLGQKFDTHTVDLKVPMALTDAELASLREEKLAEAAAAGAEAAAVDAEADPLEGVDLDALARERALERGKHLLEARYPCADCHGKDFSGGVMIEDGAIGSWHGPNLTGGKGSVTADYTMADWDRIVRHGVKPDGTPAVMPSDDFVAMSDRELSDIVAYIQSMPPVDNEVAPISFGPIGFMLTAAGEMPLSAEHIPHQADHAVEPPPTEPTATFGAHLIQVCTGCHRKDLSGGPMPFGPPDWPPSANLTPHEQGLAGWTYEQFVAAMRDGTRPDGTQLRAPMTLIAPYAKAMTEDELRALWAYLTSIEGRPTGT